MKINIDNTVLSLVKFTVITIFSRFQKYKKISIRHVQHARLSSNNYVTIANIYIYTYLRVYIARLIRKLFGITTLLHS